MAQYTVLLTPDTPQTITFTQGAVAASINNQSNCWVTYNDIYIAGPWQQSIYSFPAADPNPNLQLTSKAPPGQQTQPAPTGTCQVTITNQPLAPNPGVVQAQVSTVQNEVVLGTLDVPTDGSTVTLSLTIQPFTHTIVIINGSSGLFDISNRTISYSLLGNQTGAYYARGATIEKGAIESTSIDPAADQTVLLLATADGNDQAANLTILGSPFSTEPINVDVTNPPTNPVNVGLWLATGGSGNELAGQAYQYPASGDGVVASDRPLDAWVVAGNNKTSLTRAAQGADTINVLTAFMGNIGQASSGPGATEVLSISPFGYGHLLVLPASAQAASTISMSALRWAAPPNTAITISCAQASSTETDLMISGFTVKVPNA